jgi:hypothetical protein
VSAANMFVIVRLLSARPIGVLFQNFDCCVIYEVHLAIGLFCGGPIV